MITVVVGHRGTGKSDFIHRMQNHLRGQDVTFVDLDDEVEKKIGKTIRQLFFEHGEEYFRELERQLFLEILQKPHTDMYLVAGAGFDVTVIPENVRVLWVRRQTDMDGRIFLNRPRLNPELSPIEEFLKRGRVREIKYAEASDETYLMPEGVFENRHYVLATEKALITHGYFDVGGCVTLLPSLFTKKNRWTIFKERFVGHGVELFELREDFLTIESVIEALTEMASERFIFSFREVRDRSEFWKSEQWQYILTHAAWIDWALEAGAPEEIFAQVPKEKLILSAHDSLLKENLISLEDKAQHLKYAPLVETYAELMDSHRWQQSKSLTRSFLPRSSDGRWAWYRLLQKGQQMINYWRDGEGSASDQPTLFHWLMTPIKTEKFAAVLGDPVVHSFTPVEQVDFFHKRNMPVFAVNIRRDEWQMAFPILQDLGLRYAAVTAPLKEFAAQVCHHPEFKALNTLFFNEKKKTWIGTSTDDQGFADLIEGASMLAPLQKEIFVWGGGGTLGMIERALPHATYFSSRTGEPREGSDDAKNLLPKILIWAAPRNPDTKMPPSEWSPAMVFDLNYKEDSMGREYAQKSSSNYESGLVMFISQAQQQRGFWIRCEEEV